LVAIFIYDHNFTISYDEVTTNLRRFYDRKFVIRFFENRAPDGGVNWM